MKKIVVILDRTNKPVTLKSIQAKIEAIKSVNKSVGIFVVSYRPRAVVGADFKLFTPSAGNENFAAYLKNSILDAKKSCLIIDSDVEISESLLRSALKTKKSTLFFTPKQNKEFSMGMKANSCVSFAYGGKLSWNKLCYLADDELELAKSIVANQEFLEPVEVFRQIIERNGCLSCSICTGV